MNRYLRLIRLPNLLLLVICIFLYGKNILYPSLVAEGIVPRLVTKDFLSVLFVVMCMAAAGYVHNDITDTLTDEWNQKRGTLTAGIKMSVAWIFYVFLILAPLPLIYYLSTEADNLALLLGYGVIHIALFSYNRFLQRLPLIGNFVVALLCGIAVIVPIFLEAKPLQELLSTHPYSGYGLIRSTVVLALFSGLANLIREMIKDIEDMEGDKEAEYRTLPILFGINHTKSVILLCELILGVGIAAWLYSLNIPLAQLVLKTILLIVPLVYLLYRTSKAQQIEDFGYLSQLVKLYFAIGAIALLVL